MFARWKRPKEQQLAPVVVRFCFKGDWKARVTVSGIASILIKRGVCVCAGVSFDSHDVTEVVRHWVSLAVMTITLPGHRNPEFVVQQPISWDQKRGRAILRPKTPAVWVSTTHKTVGQEQ